MALKLPPRWNVHHTYWAKSEYTTRFEKKFREHHGNLVAVPVINHNLLHARVAPPPKPERDQMGDLMDYLDDTPVAVQFDRLWGVNKAIQFFGQIACQDTEEAFKARRIHDNLQDQIGYLSMQLVEIKIL